MSIKQITIAGKEVYIAYCFATEIGFKKLTGVGIDEFNANDNEHILYLIVAAISAYYQSKGEDIPINADNIIYEANKDELIGAVKAVIELRADWYELPFGEEEKKEDEGKNV